MPFFLEFALGDPKILVAVLVGLPFFWVVLSWLATSRSRGAHVEAGRSTLVHPRAMKVLAALFLLAPGAIALVAAYDPPKATERSIPIYLGLALLAFALPFATESYVRTISFDQDRLASDSPWTGRRYIPWNEIASAEFDQSMMWYVLTSRAGVKIRISWFMSGLPSLGEILLQKSELGSVREVSAHMSGSTS